ncbi:DNA repair protein RAD51 homolog 3-like isoform X2 [Bombyx mandarina]|uniref:DNA repair protein RAD51 homolog 3 n=1 Tax=Bombyx mandarina TaxID=7092 RepID=A0A6J2KFG2_BOMMA|nr:DNA repair protein RAD51 homolog 3-like isoform X2 [Bombyx mandarina]
MSNYKIHTATELWQKETCLPSIPTFSQNLDHILANGGVQLGSLTELLGLPGTGKTQLCLQLCASVQIPKVLSGLNAEALYIDTNTNFTPTRFKEILTASLLKCQKIEPSYLFNEEEALDRLHYINAFGIEKFCACMNRISVFLAEHPRVKLIVIDSITFPFKEGISVQKRTGLLFRQMADLQRIAMEGLIAVVLVNEMSTRLGLSGGAVVGSLGDAWAHRCNKRLLLSNPSELGGSRLALLLKSNNAPNFVAKFQITREGIRDS